MRRVFKISHTWSRRPRPLPFTPQDYVDASPIFLGLEHFLTINTGQFVLQVGNSHLAFDLRPDLSTIFERIPEVLHELLKKDSHTELYFYEQGSDVKLLLQNEASSVRVRFETGSSARPEFRQLSGTEALVSLSDFMTEWIRFARSVLHVIAEVEPALSREAAYEGYNERLRQLESMAPDYGSR